MVMGILVLAQAGRCKAKASFLFSMSYIFILLLRPLVMRPMTDNLSLALLAMCDWVRLMWQKCLKMWPSLSLGTFTFRLAMSTLMMFPDSCAVTVIPAF